ncbi:hypothetical protein ACLQ3A_26285 [Micromonospora zamorensis]|uniref:hypothetical protein n=1 Tax=Micromonospora zamorensis TaxID=709883 RepID=UPI003CF5BABA
MTAAPRQLFAAANSWSDNHQLCQFSSCVHSGNIWGEAYGAVNRNTGFDTGFDTSTQTGYFYYGYNRAFGLRKQNSNGVWTFLNPRTGTWTGASH